MTAVVISLCILCQVLIVVGQLLLKHAIGAAPIAQPIRLHRARNFVFAIACMTVWFFLWLGLMRRWPLSKLFPFEGLNPALMAIGAWLVLREKLPAKAWIGLALITVGITLVAAS